MIALRIALGAFLLTGPALLTGAWVQAAKQRLEQSEEEPDAAPVAIAAAADEEYCNARLKTVLRRVLLSCGLAGGEGRGCQPVDAKSVATMSGSDFNALFLPLEERAAIVQFDRDDAVLDADDSRVLEQTFADQRGASYFLVVARASPEGSLQHNRELSKTRAQAVMSHLRETFQDPDLDREVGLLWLGEEFAQLEDQFCDWKRSGDSKACKAQDLNRSAFVAWIDCRL